MVGVLVGACSRDHQFELYGRPVPPRVLNCPRPVRLIEGEDAYQGTYREITRISVACQYRAPLTCDEALLARGCELGADAVWVKQTSSTRVNAPSLMTKEGLAISFPSPADASASY